MCNWLCHHCITCITMCLSLQMRMYACVCVCVSEWPRKLCRLSHTHPTADITRFLLPSPIHCLLRTFIQTQVQGIIWFPGVLVSTRWSRSASAVVSSQCKSVTAVLGLSSPLSFAFSLVLSIPLYTSRNSDTWLTRLRLCLCVFFSDWLLVLLLSHVKHFDAK